VDIFVNGFCGRVESDHDQAGLRTSPNTKPAAAENQTLRALPVSRDVLAWSALAVTKGTKRMINQRAIVHRRKSWSLGCGQTKRI
jgi:hypothetical protein